MLFSPPQPPFDGPVQTCLEAVIGARLQTAGESGSRLRGNPTPMSSFPIKQNDGDASCSFLAGPSERASMPRQQEFTIHINWPSDSQGYVLHLPSADKGPKPPKSAADDCIVKIEAIVYILKSV